MSKGEVLIYQGKDGLTQVSVRLQDETLWLSQGQMAELFQTTKQNVSLHIQNVLDSGELEAEGTVKDYLTVQVEGRRKVKRNVAHYNLDMIISVGYQVTSHVRVHFRPGYYAARAEATWLKGPSPMARMARTRKWCRWPGARPCTSVRMRVQRASGCQAFGSAGSPAFTYTW